MKQMEQNLITHADTHELARDEWKSKRENMERLGLRTHPRKNIRKKFWLEYFYRVVRFFLSLTGLDFFTKKSVLDIQLTRKEVYFDNLPLEFDGYKLLHITDLHFDFVPEVLDATLAALPDELVDLAVFTGDYQEVVRGDHSEILEPMKKLCDAIQSKNGILATLGNHDTAAMVQDFESFGIKVLVNESVRLQRGNSNLEITGLDDVHYYFTEAAMTALTKTKADFKIALVHSNEMAAEAGHYNYSFYLCGHTHGGQICLPGGTPVIWQTDHSRDMAKGIWRFGNLVGYTNRGAGVIALPIRLFSQGEIALFTLRRGTCPPARA
jgi:predicted MPP superfamily phosphohydrolase